MSNFEIFHNGSKIGESDGFDLLVSDLMDYRKKGYNGVTVFRQEEKGVPINNLPLDQCGNGKQTGFFCFDVYGCWYEVSPNNGMDNYWMVGEAPYHY